MTAPETQLAELDTQLAAAVPTGDAEAVEKKRCDRCNLLCDPTEGHARSKSKWVCKDCYATGMTIARHGLNVESDMSHYLRDYREHDGPESLETYVFKAPPHHEIVRTHVSGRPPP